MPTKAGFWKMTPGMAALGAAMIVFFIVYMAAGWDFMEGVGLMLALGIVFVIGGISGGVWYRVHYK